MGHPEPLQKIHSIDADIRGGRGKQAQATLQACLAEGVNREDAAAFELPKPIIPVAMAGQRGLYAGNRTGN
ncbi:MAG: hypothetical protein KDD39_03875 [Bdellovibrionales bacterium]|nr:hypothetical protein [Bdellovibrionales bacterium]